MIEIAVPAVRREIDLAIHHEHAFGREQAHLLPERLAAGRKRDASVRAQHAVPRQWLAFPDAEHVTDEPRASRQAGTRGDLAVARHRALGDREDRARDARFRARVIVALAFGFRLPAVD